MSCGTLKSDYIVACHLPRGSKLQWREDMGGVLPNAREPKSEHFVIFFGHTVMQVLA